MEAFFILGTQGCIKIVFSIIRDLLIPKYLAHMRPKLSISLQEDPSLSGYRCFQVSLGERYVGADRNENTKR
jgi:hypothetical protein